MGSAPPKGTSLCGTASKFWRFLQQSWCERFGCRPLEHTHTRAFNGPLSGTTQVSRYQKGKTNLDFTGARDSEWQWHQLGHMQVCTSLQTDNHDSTPPLSFLHAGCPSCHPTNSIKALKAVQGTEGHWKDPKNVITAKTNGWAKFAVSHL